MHHAAPGRLLFLGKVTFLVFIFGIFPAFVSIVAINYKHKADLVLEEQTPQYAVATANETLSPYDTGGVKVLTSEQAKTIQKAHSLMIGKWVSLQDKKYVVEMLPNSTFTDKDDGKLVAYGTWGNFVAATSSSNLKLDESSDGSGVNNSESSYYLTKMHYEDKYKSQKFIYEIMQLDEDRVILYYTGNSKILYFVRAKDGAGTASTTINK